MGGSQFLDGNFRPSQTKVRNCSPPMNSPSNLRADSCGLGARGGAGGGYSRRIVGNCMPICSWGARGAAVWAVRNASTKDFAIVPNTIYLDVRLWLFLSKVPEIRKPHPPISTLETVKNCTIVPTKKSIVPMHDFLVSQLGQYPS